jgi:hypothetical protein
MRKVLIYCAMMSISALPLVGCDGDDDVAVELTPVEECQERAAETGLFCPEVSDCSCEHCTEYLEECDASPECMAIVQCVADTGCGGGVACYIGPCGQVIDDNGGPYGEGASIATVLEECTSNANCPGLDTCD